MSIDEYNGFIPNASLFKQTRTKYLAIAMLGLWFPTATLIAAHNLMLEKAQSLVSSSNSFSSLETLLTIASGAMVFGALISPLLEAVIMMFVAKLARPVQPVRVSEAWLWLLIAQIPFNLIVQVLYAIGGFGLVSVVNEMPIRIVFGVVNFLIFGVFLWKIAKAAPVRAAIVSAIPFVINLFFVRSWL